MVQKHSLEGSVVKMHFAKKTDVHGAPMFKVSRCPLHQYDKHGKKYG